MGGSGMKFFKPVQWKRADSGQKVMKMRPTAYKASVTEEQLRVISENLKANPNVNLLYSVFDERDKTIQRQVDELESMFEDNEKVIVLNSLSHNNKKR